MKQWKLISSHIIILLIFFGLSNEISAAEVKKPSDEETFALLQDAFDVQVSLTEKERTLDDISTILSQYFSESLIVKYVDANVHEFEGGYIAYATDFPQHTIPFFDYNEYTKVIYSEDMITVYQFFKGSSEGPVTYDDHYQVVNLKLFDGHWKIDSIHEAKTEPEKGTVEPEKNEKESTVQEKDSASIKDEHLVATKSAETIAFTPLQSSINAISFNGAKDVHFLLKTFSPFYFTTQKLLGGH
ncbi:DUF3993 domain-containing protein [Metabacillus herbersteinensis]|uniref:DUF3993 domain-containing protein n=1 Tax=Metabacillus herbersteinensis TaxID=283816 RepID=A0ABV6GAK5_9BACI